MQALTPFLGPEHSKWLPTLRSLKRSWDGNEQRLGSALWRIGERREALDVVARSLETDYAPTRIAAALWLAQRGQDARPVEPTLRRGAKRAKGGEWAQLVLALRRVSGGTEDEATARALDALDDLLSVCADESAAVGDLYLGDFWAQELPYSIKSQEHNAVADAVDTLLWAFVPGLRTR